MSCYGGRCDEGDLLWIQQCNDALIQRFVWEPVPVPATGRKDTGRLKPYLNQSLCLEYVASNGTYSHFGETGPYWWYFLLKPCAFGNQAQILEGHDDSNPFEILARDDSQEDPVRCLSQAHDPRAGEIILGEIPCEQIDWARVIARSMFVDQFVSFTYTDYARLDFTSLWDKYEIEPLPEIPNPDMSEFCPPWPLMTTKEIVASGNTLVNWDADTFVEQHDNGRFVIRRGLQDGKELILFDNELNLPRDDYFTQLRGKYSLVHMFAMHVKVSLSLSIHTTAR